VNREKVNRIASARCRLPVAALFGVAAACALLLGAGSVQAAERSQVSLSTLEANTISQINDLRVADGLHPLVFSPALFEAAGVHCQQMLDGGYFGHQTPSGGSFSIRLETYYPPRETGSYVVGENLFRAHNGATSSEIVRHWMESPEHRANLLDPAWRQIGLATMTVTSAPGVYGGSGATVVTVDFGARS
jgi:uncharacterized protein YkwD